MTRIKIITTGIFLAQIIILHNGFVPIGRILPLAESNPNRCCSAVFIPSRRTENVKIA
jgi:hypothetical protein